MKTDTDIVAIARQYLGADLVERAPGDFWTCCPFHDEATPSFHVLQGKGRYKCFGCGVSGDAIDFMMRLKGLSYREAVKAITMHDRLQAPLPRQAVRQSQPRLPTAHEVQALLSATVPVDEDDEVAALLRARGIDPIEVAARVSLARALPSGAPCPPWARKVLEPGRRAQAWSRAGYRLITPLFAPGSWAPVSVRARRTTLGEPKSVAAVGITTRNQVMADALGRYLLAHGRVPDDWPHGASLRIVIAEGEPDFWTLATHWPDAHPAPAVFGVVSGAWTPEIARCIPTGAKVEIRTDADVGGEHMADAIVRDLIGRCHLERVTARARS